MSAKSTTAPAERPSASPWKNIGKLAGVLGMLLTSFAGGAVYNTPLPPTVEGATLPPAKLIQMAEDVASIKRDLQLLRDEVKELQGEKRDGG